jgi:dihydroneopterin aldolase
MATHSIPWTIEVRALATELRAAGSRDGNRFGRQAATVDITVGALAPAFPETIEDCINYQPICEHVLGAWSETACGSQPALAVCDLIAFILDFDGRIGHVDVALTTGGATLRLAQARRLERPRLYA